MAGNNNVHRGPARDKPFRDALRLEAKALEAGDVVDHPRGSLRWNAQRLLMLGEVPSIKETADRLDGKVPQAVTGEDGGPILLGFLTDHELDELEKLRAAAETRASDAGGDSGGEGDPPSQAPSVIVPDNGR